MLILLALAGCAHPTLAPSRYRVILPTLTVPVRDLDCVVLGKPAECVVLLRQDYVDLVIELKAACLAGGQPEAECQATLPTEAKP